jgi:hypothetical protein
MLFILALNGGAHTALQEFNPHFWTGHTLHASLGFIADQIRHTQPGGTKIIMRGNATFFYGYEYGWQFAQHGFLGGGLEWTIAYPRNFLSNVTPLKKTLAWLQPLTHLRIGYVFNNHALLSVGLTYLWALSLNFRAPLGEHLFLEAQYLQWFDELLNLKAISPTFGAGFDFANFGLGFGWKF